jgi:hypothetical protein
MPDLVYINYNGVNAFAPQPTPFIGLGDQTIYADEIWGRAETMTLQGQLTGCTYSDIVDAQRTLLSRFNKSYQTLEVFQQTGAVSERVFQKDLVQVNSVDFAQGGWYGVLPYTITLTCYPSGLFSGAYGVLNPQDTWAFDERQNASLDVTHTISCQPFNTSSGPSNALTNARDWAYGRTGTDSFIAPIFISGVSLSNLCLLTQQETIDRFNGTYSLVENYTNDLARTGYGVIRYTTDISSGGGLISVSLNGNAQGCGRNITGLRYALNRLNWTAIAANQYQSTFNRTDLNPIPLSQSYNEDPFATTISFTSAYDNSNLPEVLFDYTVNCSVGTNGFISASIQGTVTARGGDTTSKLNRCKAYASGVSLYNLVLPFYNAFDASSITPLNPVAAPSSQTNHETDGTVDLAATFNNRPQNSSILDSFTASINVTPSLAQVDAQPVLDGNGAYSVVNLNYGSRSRVAINGNAVINRNASATAGQAVVRQQAFALFGQYGNAASAALEVNNLTVSRTDERVVSFSFVWSCGPTFVVGPTTVTTLRP